MVPGVDVVVVGGGFPWYFSQKKGQRIIPLATKSADLAALLTG